MFTDPQPTPAAADMPPPRKFMFDHSFDGQAGVRVPERKPVTLKPEQYDALKQESYDSGFTAGRKAGFDDQTDKMMQLIERVGTTIEQMLGAMQVYQKQCEDGMRKTALAIARKVLPEFASRNGLQEIEALLGGVMAEMVHEPRLVIRVSEKQFDVLNEKITTLATQKAYAGKVVILAEAEIVEGDCRIEWADGGMERNTEAMMNKIEKTISP